jgi:hypothetical protein
MMTIKNFSDQSMTQDAYPSMRIGEKRSDVRGDHLFITTATNEVGCDTGRRRYRVVCRSCRVLVHPATTGPMQNMEFHEREVARGELSPYPGTEIGVES